MGKKGKRGLGQGSVASSNDRDREPERNVLQRVDRAALTLARIIGRRMAREDFEARRAVEGSDASRAHGEPKGSERDE